jgi:hypothetical protein
MCACKAHNGIAASVPSGVPKRGPTTIILQPTLTNVPIKTGLKSLISGPFCDSWQPYQTAAFSLSATSPQTFKYTCSR